MDMVSPNPVNYRRPNESLHGGSVEVRATVGDFWAWSASDLVANTTRGLLAEYIVGVALDAVQHPRQEWAAWDLTTPSGAKVEVKSAAFLQGWEQRKPSDIRFRIPKTLTWSDEIGYSETEPKWQADVYVFALLAEIDRMLLDPLNLDQWEFYVVATSLLEAKVPTAKSLSLATLRGFRKGVRFEELKAAVKLASPTGVR